MHIPNNSCKIHETKQQEIDKSKILVRDFNTFLIIYRTHRHKVNKDMEYLNNTTKLTRKLRKASPNNSVTHIILKFTYTFAKIEHILGLNQVSVNLKLLDSYKV